jgi:hypothetical protein
MQNPLSEKTQKLLNEKVIQGWQASLRENIPLKTIVEFHPTVNTESPDCAPTWAGGKGTLPPESPKTLSWKELSKIETGFADDSLLPWEAAILFEQTNAQMAEWLDALNITDVTTPAWVPAWAKCGETETPNAEIQPEKPAESPTETEHLKHYWKLKLLTVENISNFLNKEVSEIEIKRRELGLEAKETEQVTWCGTQWHFLPNSPEDPRFLDTETQNKLIETSATRLALLYETPEASPKEIEKILTLNLRIFSKYITNQTRKYRSVNCKQAQQNLEQAGNLAVFETLRNWHPKKGAFPLKKVQQEIVTKITEEQRKYNTPQI